MSTSPSPKPALPAGPSHPTRQLLDELDALMKRMLALPVNQIEDELRAKAERATAAAEAPAADRPPMAPEDGETGPDSPAAEELPADWPAEEDTPEDREQAREHDAPSVLVAEEEPDLERIIPASPEVLAAIGRPPREPERKRDPAPREPDSAGVTALAGGGPGPAVAVPPVWLRPLVWSNRAFDRCMAWLGGPGQWLRGHNGRAMLGWTGLGLLAGALAWLLANQIGWTR
jgi:hypothetical protein